MNTLFIGILTTIVTIGVLCIGTVIDNTPALPVIGLVLACILFGYILGENT